MNERKNRKIFAFDIDGTILNNKGELINDIAPFIIRMKKEYPDARFALVTSGTVSTARYAARKIGGAWAASIDSDYHEKSEKLLIDIAALGGSYIFSGVQVAGSTFMAFKKARVNTPLSFLNIADVNEFLKNKKFGDTDILFYQKEGMVHAFFSSQNPLSRHVWELPKSPTLRSGLKIGKQQTIISLLKLRQSVRAGIIPNPNKKEYYNIRMVSSKQLREDIERGRVYTLGILPLSRGKSKLIAKELSEHFTPTGLSVTTGTLLEVSHSNKWQALKNLYKENAENVIYFGDGKNDRECLKNCKTSFALGNRLEVLKSGKYRIESFADATDICLSGEETVELIQKTQTLIQSAEENAEKKANNIRSKIKAALDSNENKEMGM